MRRVLLLAPMLIICFFYHVFAQTLKIDSLQEALKNEKQDTSRLSLLNQLCKAYWYINPEESIKVGRQALQLAEKLNNEKGLSTASFNLGIGYWSESQYDSALEKIAYALHISQRLKDQEGTARAYGGLGIVYRNKGDYPSALAYQMKALAINEKLNNARGMAIAYTNVGNIYFNQGDLVKALDYSLKALRIYESNGNLLELAGAYNNIGVIYKNRKNHEEALAYYQKALKLQKKINDKKGIAHAYVNIGNVFAAQHKDSLAITNFSQALALYKELGDQQGIAATLTNIGDTFYAQEAYQTALEKYLDALALLRKIGHRGGIALTLNAVAKTYLSLEQYPLAVQYAQKSLEIADELQAKPIIKGAAKTLYQAYYQLGNDTKALHYHVLFTQYKDSLLNQESIRKIEKIKFGYEMEKKETENDLLRSQNEQQVRQIVFQKTWRNILIVGSLLLLGLAFAFLRGKQKEKKANLLLSQKNEEISVIAENLTTVNAEIEAQKQTLERLNQSKDRLFSIISHDLRSPLNSLHGLLLLLQEGRLSQSEIQQILPEFSQRLHQSHHLLDNLLVWAKSQMQGLGPHPRKVNLQWIVEETVELLQASAGQKNITIKNNIDNAVEAFADPDMLRLVLRNLMTNAIKFTPAGGKVSIAAKVIDVDFVQVEVSDTGVGIGEEEQKKLFQATSYTTQGTAGEKGTGLGLLLSKDFIESQGGTLWVKSQKGQGSTFIFTVPTIAPDGTAA